MGKVFNNILNTRLDSFLTEHNLIPPSQVGFTKHAMVYFTFRNMFFSVKRLRIFAFPQNLTLGYMAKTLNKIIFFSSTKIKIFFSATLGARIFFLEKKYTIPPPFKLNGRYPIGFKERIERIQCNPKLLECFGIHH